MLRWLCARAALCAPGLWTVRLPLGFTAVEVRRESDPVTDSATSSAFLIFIYVWEVDLPRWMSILSPENARRCRVRPASSCCCSCSWCCSWTSAAAAAREGHQEPVESGRRPAGTAPAWTCLRRSWSRCSAACLWGWWAPSITRCSWSRRGKWIWAARTPAEPWPRPAAVCRSTCSVSPPGPTGE